MEDYVNPKTKIILSLILWGTIGIFVRGIELSSLEIAFFRAFLGGGFLILISIIKKDKIDKKMLRKNILALSLSGLALGINWITLFQAMKYTTISNAILSYYFAPVFLVIFSAVLLKEKISVKNIVYLIIALIGLFLVMKSDALEALNRANNIKGITYGLAGAVIYAIVVILNKFIKGLSAFQSTLIQLLIAAIVLMPVVVKNLSFDINMIDLQTVILMLILGVVHTGIAYLLYFSSIQHVESKSIAILSYLDPIIAIILSFLFLGETMNLIQALGGTLILTSAYMSEKR